MIYRDVFQWKVCLLGEKLHDNTLKYICWASIQFIVTENLNEIMWKLFESQQMLGNDSFFTSFQNIVICRIASSPNVNTDSPMSLRGREFNI